MHYLVPERCGLLRNHCRFNGRAVTANDLGSEREFEIFGLDDDGFQRRKRLERDRMLRLAGVLALLRRVVVDLDLVGRTDGGVRDFEQRGIIGRRNRGERLDPVDQIGVEDVGILEGVVIEEVVLLLVDFDGDELVCFFLGETENLADVRAGGQDFTENGFGGFRVGGILQEDVLETGFVHDCSPFLVLTIFSSASRSVGDRESTNFRIRSCGACGTGT